VAASCATEICESTDAATCCINKATCSDYDCDLNTQLHLASNYCYKEDCDSLDVGNCCLDRASCMGFQFCLESQQLNEQAICMTGNCTEVDDVATCCTDLPTCGSYSCSSTEILIKNASRTYCESSGCQAIDCCETKANCSTYNNCEICDEHVGGYCVDTSCDSSDYDTCCRKIVPQLDNSKGVRLKWNVSLEGEISMSDHDAITDTIAVYLNLPCIWVNGSYTSEGSTWNSVYEIFVSTEGNDNAGTELKTDLEETSTIDGLKDNIATNLNISLFSISLSTVSIFSEANEESSSEGLSTGIIVVIAVGAVLIIAGVIVAFYKYNQRKKGGVPAKVSDVFEM